MKETGTVIRMKGGQAVVTFGTHEGCGTCGLHGVCTATGGGRRELILEPGPFHLKTGDRVEIETPARSLLTAAFLVFILPLIVSASAYMIAWKFTGRNGPALAGFFGGFVLTEGLVALIDRMAGRRRFFKPRICRKLDV
jgi:positive regulator of sigma E activity